MTVRPIRIFPDPVLSRPCAVVDLRDPSLPLLIDDLIDTLASSPGVGLAAPQIGVEKRVSVIDVSRLKRKPLPPNHGRIVLINPELREADGEQVPREGCLSVPDLLANVKRHARVVVSTLSLDGAAQQIEAIGFEALAFQHELDHLDGRLFLDRVVNLKTDIFRRKER